MPPASRGLLGCGVMYQNFRGPCCLQQIGLLWFVTSCSVVVGYQNFRGPVGIGMGYGLDDRGYRV
jgi:hypothetical protein